MTQEQDLHTDQIQQLRKSDDEQWLAINTLRGRLDELMHKWIPVWVAVVLTAMGGITGSALTFAGMIIKFASSK